MGDSEIEAQPVVLSLSDFRDMLRCPVCLDRYDERTHLPKLLNCHHTICLGCLKGIFREPLAQRFLDPDATVKRCPQCRTVIQLTSCVERMPTNFYIQTFRHAVNNARRQAQGGSNETGDGEFVFPQCSTHTANNVSIPATMWCEECEKTLCSMCLFEGHAADHSMTLVPEKVRQLKDEADAFRSEICEIQTTVAGNRESLSQSVTRFMLLTDVISESIDKYEENVRRKMEAIAIPEDATDSVLERGGPCDMRAILDYARSMREARASFRRFVLNNNIDEIFWRLNQMMRRVTDFQREIDELIQ